VGVTALTPADPRAQRAPGTPGQWMCAGEIPRSIQGRPHTRGELARELMIMSPFGSVFASLLARQTPEERRVGDRDRAEAYGDSRRNRT
jgi:hypothetical protein